MQIIPLLSTVVTFAFTVAVFNRYFRRKGMHLLMWGIGLFLYGLGTLSEVLLSLQFNPLTLRIWYLCGAMLTAAWLGQGTVYLLVRKRGVATALTIGLAAVSLVAAVLVLTAPVTGAGAYRLAEPVSAQYKDFLTRSGWITLLTILLNIYGTIFLVGGALYSAYLFWRKSVLADRLIGNILIAAGALMPASAGSLIKAGLGDWLYVSELLGAAIMYIGFIKATSGKTVDKKAVAAPSPTSR